MSSDPSRQASEFIFDLGLYRLSAIKKAVYRFMGQYNVTLDRLDDNRVSVRLAPKSMASMQLLDPRTLENEVLDQELREVVAEETKSARELLLAQAFSGLALIDPTGEMEDYKGDPLEISVSVRRSPKRDT